VEDLGDYLHPGKLFVAQYGRVSDRSGVIKYAEFLREESGLGDAPPINLDPIIQRFRPLLRRVALDGQAGLLLNPDRGLIFINSDDSATRQRFSVAHELMELLFDALSPRSQWSARGGRLFSDRVKEKLCEEGAAELLMPLSTFVPRVVEWGVSLETGKRLAELYDVSLIATLVRSVRYGPGQHALVLWRLALKPSEQKVLPSDRQLSLFEDWAPQSPPKKLRVRWGCSTQDKFFIPKHKSVEFDTTIYQCYESGTTAYGTDWIDLASVYGQCYCESMPITLDREAHVLSVIHLPG
jgi:hypothetical protein